MTDGAVPAHGASDCSGIAILSDLDGTLIDSKASVIRAFEWWADLRGIPPRRGGPDSARSNLDGRRCAACALTRRGKPHPDPFLLGAKLLGARVQECIVLEDAPSGVAAGRAAGMRVIAVLTTHRKDELPDASAYIPDLAHLQSALDALGLS